MSEQQASQVENTPNEKLITKKSNENSQQVSDNTNIMNLAGASYEPPFSLKNGG
jgi:hypothetical protein